MHGYSYQNERAGRKVKKPSKGLKRTLYDDESLYELNQFNCVYE